MEEKGIGKNQLIVELTRSEHGKLSNYVPTAKRAAKEEPEFLAHLIAWDAVKGQVRDAHVALPVVSLSEPAFPAEYVENSLAHIARLRPRELLRSYRFALEVKTPGQGRAIRGIVEKYLRNIENKVARWDQTALQHKATLKELYALTHTKPSPRAQRVLFKGTYPPGSVFESVAQLKDMPALEAAGTILERKIPFLVALGALGPRLKDPAMVMALIERMSPTELVTNTKMLERLGLKKVPELRAAYEKGLGRAATSKQTSLKTTRAAEAIGDEGLKAKLSALQEKQLDNFGGIDGDWLVLADKSGSMEGAIEVARHVSGILARMVKGKVILTFFDTCPRAFDVTGKTYEQISGLTRSVSASGGTSIGCGLTKAIDDKVDIDGIAIVSDAEENETPYFTHEYRRFVDLYGKTVPVYLYLCGTEHQFLSRYDQNFQNTMKDFGFDLQVFDLRGKAVDYYSLPNMVATMRTNRYSLVEEILSTKLLRLDEIFKEQCDEYQHRCP